MPLSDGIVSAHAVKLHHLHHSEYTMICLITVAYAFDTIVSLTLPSSALIGLPFVYKQILDEFSNPLLLLGIYLASVCEIFVLFRVVNMIRIKLHSVS